MPCQQCHIVAYGPALTAYGRQFKLNGYVFGENQPQFPVAVMVQGGYTHTGADQPEAPAPQFGLNNQTSVDQVSLFIANRISSNTGLFAQITYDGVGRVTTWDNLDLRMARAFTFGDTAIVAGISVNNNPTVQDLWNSTPAWGFPYISSALAPAPTAAPFITGMGQAVLGATAYAMVNDRFYVEAGAYHGLSNKWLDNLGVGADANLNLTGLSPYWRAAVQFDRGKNYFSVGTFGIEATVQPDPTVPEKDRYTDFGFDATYQYVGRGKHVLAANASLIHERQHLAGSFAVGGSDAEANDLQSINVDVSYAYDRTWVGTAAGFSTTGSTNLALYPSGVFSGSNNGSPDSQGYTVQLEYIPYGKADSFGRPWLNVRLGLQYTGYTKFNGGTSNYDGFGRAAADNNTLFAYFWIIL